MSVGLSTEAAQHYGFVEEQNWWPSHLEGSLAQRAPPVSAWDGFKVSAGDWAQVSSAHDVIRDCRGPQSMTLWAPLWPRPAGRVITHLTNGCTRTDWSQNSCVWIFQVITSFQTGLKRKVSQPALALLYITARRNDYNYYKQLEDYHYKQYYYLIYHTLYYYYNNSYHKY